MDFLDTANIQEEKSSDYSEDDVSNEIDYDSLQFETPVKDKDNLYIAHLEEKIIIELDNLDIFEILEEENGKKFVFFNLDLDNEDQEELIELLYNLDEVAVDNCIDHSKEWFNKELSEEQIENLYIPLYIDNYKTKNHILMKVEINPNIDITIINNSNINFIEIKGLVFYKKTFMYHVYLDRVIEETVNLLNSIKNNLIDSNSTENKNKSINKPINNKNTLIQDTVELNTPNKEQDIEKNKIKKHIEEKRLQVKENFLKSEEINKTAEQLRMEAVKSANELKNLELQLQNK
jgi:hypothetical protein